MGRQHGVLLSWRLIVHLVGISTAVVDGIRRLCHMRVDARVALVEVSDAEVCVAGAVAAGVRLGHVRLTAALGVGAGVGGVARGVWGDGGVAWRLLVVSRVASVGVVRTTLDFFGRLPVTTSLHYGDRHVAVRRRTSCGDSVHAIYTCTLMRIHTQRVPILVQDLSLAAFLHFSG